MKPLISTSFLSCFCILSIVPFLFGKSALYAETIKCGTPLFAERISQNRRAGKELSAAAWRPSLQTSILSPSGKFRIHFDTSSSSNHLPSIVDMNGNRITGTASQYIDSVAAIFDFVWNTEVTILGFPSPPPDSKAGGGDEFDIYIEDLGNVFGETNWDDNAPLTTGKLNPKFASFIRVHNDFGSGFRTKGIPALRVTAAHEFFHAIQVGAYGVWRDKFSVYEMTAESMEPLLFPSIKDYIFDIPRYFSNIDQIPLHYEGASYRGYERTIWAVYLRQQYGIGIIKKLWELIDQNEPMDAMNKVMPFYSTSLPREFVQFSTWNWFTNYRADSTKYYPDAKLFPLVHQKDKVVPTTIPLTKTFSTSSYQINYFVSTIGWDTISTIVNNLNTVDFIDQSHAAFPFTISFASEAFEGATQIVSGLFIDLSANDPSNWNMTSIISKKILQTGEESPFPNPLKPGKSTILFPTGFSIIPLNLFIYDQSMRLIYSDEQRPAESLGKYCIRWDGKNLKGEKAGTGVYIYYIQSGNKEWKGKVAIIR